MNEQAPAAAPRARLVAHAVLAGIGLVALAISLRLGLWRQSSPGEGLFPFLTALAMVTFSVAGLVRDWLRREAAPARAGGDRAGLIRVGAYLGALVFYAVSLEFLGFIVATALTITFILRVRRALSLGRDVGPDRGHGHRLPGPVRALARRHAADRHAVGGPVPAMRRLGR